jgi:hypothetical protein
MRIAANGDVGIGSSPAVRLHVEDSATEIVRVKGSGNTGGVYIDADGGGSSGYGGIVVAQQNSSTCGIFGVTGAYRGNTNADVGIFAESGRRIEFAVNGNPTPAMVVHSGGSFLINSIAVAVNEKLLVKSTGGANAWTQVSWNNAGTSDNKFIEFGTESAYTARGSISYNRSGGLVAYNTTSDVRLKKNIADSVDAGDKIDSIKVRQFDWIETGNHLDYAFIAQELHQSAPHAVTVPEDDERMWSVDYSKLVPMLTKEIQSLRARVASLEMN